MKPSELATMLVSFITHRVPILITGAPGIGKSDLVAQAAIEADADLILSHPAVADPTDAKGLPWVVDGSATFLPFGDLTRAINAEKRTVWFLDDLGQASPAVQASYMQLLLARRVNEHVLSDQITFVAATNRRTDKAGVSGILEPVKSRFGAIVQLDADLDESCAYAIDREWEPSIPAFWRFKPELLSHFVASADLVNSPSPRTWSHVNKIVAMDLPHAIRHQAIVGAIGEGAATEYSAFLRLYETLPSVDQILTNPDSVDVPKDPATLYALSGALAHRTTPKNFDRIAKFVNKMVDKGKGEFGVLVVRDALQRDSKIAQTQAYVKLACGELGALISGK